MKKLRKRILSLIIAFVMALSLIPLGQVAYAADEINKIEVLGGFTPTVGAKADVSSLNVATGVPYTLSSGAYFYDRDSETRLTSTDEFQAGKRYFLHVHLEPKSGYYFADDSEMTAALQGADVDYIDIIPAGGGDYPNRSLYIYFKRLADNGSDTFDITVNPPANGTASATASKATAGETITITATPDSSDYEVEKITYTPEGESAQDITSTKSFTMPEKNVTVDVTFKKRQ